jgi:hypothetical protein
VEYFRIAKGNVIKSGDFETDIFAGL